MTVETSITPSGGGEETTTDVGQEQQELDQEPQPVRQNITIGSIETFVEDNPAAVLVALAVMLFLVAWFLG